MSKSLKTAFDKVHTIEPIYTGGPVSLTSDAKFIFSFLDQVILTCVESCQRICSFVGDSSQVTAIVVSPSSKFLATFAESFCLSIYELPDNLLHLKDSVSPLHKVARSHEAPVHVVTVDSSNRFLASGSADGIVKIWDLSRGFATHLFRGHAGVISAIAFHLPSLNEPNRLHVLSASVDNKINIHEMLPGSASTRPLRVLEGHTSVPRSLAVSEDGRWLLSGGRDGVVLLWNYYSQISKEQSARHKPSPKVIPVFERVEALGLLPLSSHELKDQLSFYIGGESGKISIWEAHSGKKLTVLDSMTTVDGEVSEDHQIVDIFKSDSLGVLTSVHANQNVLFYSVASHRLLRCLIGYNDEVIDSTLLSANDVDTQLALATNSALIRLYSLKSFDCRLLTGHKDIVLCVKSSVSGSVLGSGSKDNTVRLWRHDLDMSWRTVGICEGHTESVGSIAFPRLPNSVDDLLYFFSGSQDRTIKMWDLSVLKGEANKDVTSIKMKTLSTIKAHEKDINSLDISPDDLLLASGSQDKAIKVYDILYRRTISGCSGELKLAGTLKGHKRGVWDVKFHPSEKTLASASGDKTIKLWSITDFTCIKTLEEHSNSVLRLEFLSQGSQLVSSASDGLVKIWNLDDERCITSLDNHEDKVWALCVSKDERFIISGAGDSVVTIWEDVTDRKAVEQEEKRNALVQKEQSYNNLLQIKDFRNAFILGLGMDHPGRLQKLFQSITTSPDGRSITGDSRIDGAIQSLSRADLRRLLRHVRSWNASSKSSEVAQRVLFAILKLRRHGDFSPEKGMDDEMSDFETVRREPGVEELINGLIPYTERHLHRLDRLLQESFVIDYIIGEMDDGGRDEGISISVK